MSMGGSAVDRSINCELGVPGTTQISLDDEDVRDLAGVPTGTISIECFYGASAVPNAQGTVSGYATGGETPEPTVPSRATRLTDIEKYPFANPSANGTDVAELLPVRENGATGHSSDVNGYHVGGGPPERDEIQKYPFASDAPATDAAALPAGRTSHAGYSSDTHGFIDGGQGPSPPFSITSRVRFPFATDTPGTGVSALLLSRNCHRGVSSTTHGYAIGGSRDGTPQFRFNIEKFSFTNPGTRADVGDICGPRLGPPSEVDATAMGTNQSDICGYFTGGNPFITRNDITKFPFASDTPSTDGGNLTTRKTHLASSSSTTHGYTHGGCSLPGPPPTAQKIDTIDRFPFASNANASNVGELCICKLCTAGSQV